MFKTLNVRKFLMLYSLKKREQLEKKFMSITSNWIARVLGRVSRFNVVLVNTNNVVRVLVISQFNF